MFSNIVSVLIFLLLLFKPNITAADSSDQDELFRDQILNLLQELAAKHLALDDKITLLAESLTALSTQMDAMGKNLEAKFVQQGLALETTINTTKSELLSQTSLLLLLNQEKMNPQNSTEPPLSNHTDSFLQTTILPTKLPTPTSWHGAIYAGENSIIIFGGSRETQALEFSTSSERISQGGDIPSSDGEPGTVQIDNSGNIFYFGGSSSSSPVHKWNPQSGRWDKVATLRGNVHRSTSYKMNDLVYIFGGDRQSQRLFVFDMLHLNFTLEPKLPFNTEAGVSARVGNDVYIFGAKESDGKVLKFDLISRDMIHVGPENLTQFSDFIAAVSDGEFLYVVGGNESYNPSTVGVYQIHPLTFETKYLPVKNIPEQVLHHWRHRPTSVFVPTLNRIYFFGGEYDYADYEKNHAEIFYVDLTPFTGKSTDPPPTTMESISETTEANNEDSNEE